MKGLGLLMLVSGLAGCKTAEDYQAELSTVYRVGMSRQEIREIQPGSPIVSAERPDSGWPAATKGPYDLHTFARSYEGRYAVNVLSCDLYGVPRNSIGIFWDYVYFDADGKLVGFHRRFID